MDVIASLSTYVPSRRGRRIRASTKANDDDASSKYVPWPKAYETTKEALVYGLQSLYWDGVRKELAQMILTLQEWQQPQYSSVELDKEKQVQVEGFEQFIDQVSESSRDFARKYSQERLQRFKASRGAKKGRRTHEELSRIAYSAYRTFKENQELKSEIKGLLTIRQDENAMERQARMLLQSAAFLDIDKVITYNSPLPRANFWRRSAPPQLTLLRFDASSMPNLKILRCKICNDAIRGVIFRCLEPNCTAAVQLTQKDSICETCFRESLHPPSHMTKFYKHFILRDIITPQISRQICVCNGSVNAASRPRGSSLFPIDKNFAHRGKGKTKVLRCGLLLLSDKVMEAKYQGSISHIEKGKRRTQARRNVKHNDQTVKSTPRNRSSKFRKATRHQQHPDPQSKIDEKTVSDIENEKLADQEIPLLYRKFTSRYPFGNVHMALMFGPLMIENGVPDSKQGVLLSTRDPISLQVPDDIEEPRREMALSHKRRLFTRTARKPLRRVKAYLKQTVADPFQGLTHATWELEIIQSLISASKNYKEDPRRTIAAQAQSMNNEVEKIEMGLKKLLGTRVTYFTTQISERLFDPNTKLTWSLTTNNCQNYCDSMLQWDEVGSFLGPQLGGIPAIDGTLYMMSFVTRSGSYLREKVVSKYDVPNGLTEEYLLKFRQGRHNDSDLVDTLQEYWYDWGAFGRTLYKYQTLFPWDCTTAYHKQPGTCNTCSLSKHIWSFPFDSHGVIRLHLSRHKSLYPPETAGKRTLTNEQWMRNRLTVLLAQDALLAATTAMYRSPLLRTAANWLHTYPHERVDRLKLGGIHRAQPFSHEFEKGRYHEYMLADWALLLPEQQVEEYEYLRDRRILLPDVVLSKGGDEGGDGGDGGDGLGDSGGVGAGEDVGWEGTVEGAVGTDYGVEDGWDGDYPDGYGDDASGGADVGDGGGDGGGYDGGDDGGYDGGDDGGGFDGGDGGGDGGGGDGGGD